MPKKSPKQHRAEKIHSQQKEPPCKRSNTELNMSDDYNIFNDSLQTLMSEIEAKDESKNCDITKLLLTFIKRDMAKGDDISQIRYKVRELEEKTIEHDVIMDELKNDTKLLKEQNYKIERSININEQKRIDLDIFVSYFPFKPNAIEIAKKLATLAQLPPDVIEGAYTFPMTSINRNIANSTRQSEPRPSYAVVVTFTSLTNKRNFLSVRSSLGPIKLSQLTNTTASDSTIKISNRLTPFNLEVARKLNQAKRDGIIAELRFRNGLFNYRINETDWKWISTGGELEALLMSNEMQTDGD